MISLGGIFKNYKLEVDVVPVTIAKMKSLESKLSPFKRIIRDEKNYFA